MKTDLWNALYLNPVSIEELTEVANEDGYKEILFKQSESRTTVTLTFEDNGDIVKAVYMFNKKGLLQLAMMIEDGKWSVMFDRSEEIKKCLA